MNITLKQIIELMEKINFEEGDRFECYFDAGKPVIQSKIIKIGGNDGRFSN